MGVILFFPTNLVGKGGGQILDLLHSLPVPMKSDKNLLLKIN
jgi:hypothetical protein